MHEGTRTELRSYAPDIEDRELIAACLRGDAAAWEALLKRYQRLIYSISIKAGLSPDDAADVFQTICLKLYQKLSTLRKQEKIVSWLITTTRRESWRVSAHRRRERASLDERKQDESMVVPEATSDTPLADQQLELIQQQQVLRQAVQGLPERCRDLLTMLFYHQDVSYAEIARRMKMPVPSIGPTRARCLEKLRAALEGKI